MNLDNFSNLEEFNKIEDHYYELNRQKGIPYECDWCDVIEIKGELECIFNLQGINEIKKLQSISNYRNSFNYITLFQLQRCCLNNKYNYEAYLYNKKRHLEFLKENIKFNF